MLSLPSRERGLKSCLAVRVNSQKFVAPFAGAWIEISYNHVKQKRLVKSLPSRERGLK